MLQSKVFLFVCFVIHKIHFQDEDARSSCQPRNEVNQRAVLTLSLVYNRQIIFDELKTNTPLTISNYPDAVCLAISVSTIIVEAI